RLSGAAARPERKCSEDGRQSAADQCDDGVDEENERPAALTGGWRFRNVRHGSGRMIANRRPIVERGQNPAAAWVAVNWRTVGTSVFVRIFGLPMFRQVGPGLGRAEQAQLLERF